jgi:hypothetical protein
MASIFVNIASYHDYELPRTIIDCINKSSGENTISFGVHMVFFKNDEIVLPDITNIKYEKFKAPEHLGVGLARSRANSFYKGEDYYLQIDSHTRFVHGWDKKLINTHNLYLSEGCNPVISAYPSGYHYENFIPILDALGPVSYTGFESTKKAQSDFKRTKFLNQESKINSANNIFTKSISGGCVFSSGDIAQIDPNKRIFYWGEEFLQALRLFTHGYDLMLPQEGIVFHLYYDGDKPVESQRRLPGLDFPDESYKMKLVSDEEIFRIISNKEVGPQSLGSARTLEDYEIYAGINFTSGMVD